MSVMTVRRWLSLWGVVAALAVAIPATWASDLHAACVLVTAAGSWLSGCLAATQIKGEA